MQRRQFIGACGVSLLGATAGCFGISDGQGKPPDGGLKVVNETSVEQRVEVTIERRPDGPRSGTSTPGSTSTPTETTELQVTVDGDGRELREGVIGTPGRYYVRAEATGGAGSEERTGRRWLRFEQAGSGDGVAGGHLLVTIGEENLHVAQVQD